MQDIIQFAIGMVLVYSLLSILVTTLNTVITNFLQWRATHLKTAIESLITDPEVQAQFLSHPLINLVQTEMVKPHQVTDPTQAAAVAQEVRSADVNGVSTIDPKIFAQVLTSILSEKASLELYGPLLLAADALPDSPAKQHVLDVLFGLQTSGIGLPDLHTAIAALPAEQQAPLLAAVKPIDDKGAAAQLAPGDGSRLLPVIEGLRNVNDDAFRTALKVVVGSAQTFDQAQQNLQDWFNQRMTQLSTLYTRNVAYLTLIVGLLIALVLNADSVQIGVSLWNDPTLRAAITSTAQDVLTNPQIAQSVLGAQSAEATPSPESTAVPGLSANAQIISASAQQVATSITQLTNLNLPIGWIYMPLTTICYASDNSVVNCNTPSTVSNPIKIVCTGPDNTTATCDDARNIWLLWPGNNPGGWFGLLIRKLLGIVVTVIAIGQGAPFWFDLIRRLVSGGSSG